MKEHQTAWATPEESP